LVLAWSWLTPRRYSCATVEITTRLEVSMPIDAVDSGMSSKDSRGERLQDPAVTLITCSQVHSFALVNYLVSIVSPTLIV